MRKNRYLHPGDPVPEGEPKRHIRKDDGRVILYWDLELERVFLQAFDSLGNFRIQGGIVQAPKRFFTCVVCKKNRSPEQVCRECNALYSVNGVLPDWILELIQLPDKNLLNGYQVQSLDPAYHSAFLEAENPLKPSLWPLNQSQAFSEAQELVTQAQRQAERTSSFCSGITLREFKQVQATRTEKVLRWNGYSYA